MRYRDLRPRIRTGDVVLLSCDDAGARLALRELGCRWSSAVVVICGSDGLGLDPDHLYAWTPYQYTLLSTFCAGSTAAIRFLTCNRTEAMRLDILRVLSGRMHSSPRRVDNVSSGPQVLYEELQLLHPHKNTLNACFWAGPITLLGDAFLSPLYRMEV